MGVREVVMRTDVKVDIIKYKNNTEPHNKSFVKLTHIPSGIALTQRVLVSQKQTAETLSVQLDNMIKQWEG